MPRGLTVELLADIVGFTIQQTLLELVVNSETFLDPALSNDDVVVLIADTVFKRIVLKWKEQYGGEPELPST